MLSLHRLKCLLLTQARTAVVSGTILLCSASFAQAEATAEKLNLATDLIKTMKVVEQMSGPTMQSILQDGLEQMRHQFPDASVEQLKKVEALLANKLADAMSASAPAWGKTFTHIYADILTIEELKAFNNFYQTKEGQNFIEKQPILTAQLAKVIPVFMQVTIDPVLKETFPELVEILKGTKQNTPNKL